MIFENCQVLACLHFIENNDEVCLLTRTVYDYEIDLHFNGDRILIVDDRRYEIKANSCVIRKPGEVVTGIGRVYDAFCLTLDICAKEKAVPFNSRKTTKPIQTRTNNTILDNFPVIFQVEHIYTAYELFEKLSHMCLTNSGNDNYGQQKSAAEKLILFLASESIYLSSEKSIIRPEIMEARNYISENFCYAQSTEMLAKRFGFSTEHFIRIFKKECGCTPTEYLIRIRMENARHMLEYSNNPVSIVAAMCGYANFSFFSQTFKKHFGITPTDYRNTTSSER